MNEVFKSKKIKFEWHYIKVDDLTLEKIYLERYFILCRTNHLIFLALYAFVNGNLF